MAGQSASLSSAHSKAQPQGKRSGHSRAIVLNKTGLAAAGRTARVWHLGHAPKEENFLLKPHRSITVKKKKNPFLS